MPRHGGSSMRKHGGSGSHRNMSSGGKGSQRKRRKNPRESRPPWSSGYTWPDVPTYEDAAEARAVAAVQHADRLTALFTGKK